MFSDSLMPWRVIIIFQHICWCDNYYVWPLEKLSSTFGLGGDGELSAANLPKFWRNNAVWAFKSLTWFLFHSIEQTITYRSIQNPKIVLGKLLSEKRFPETRLPETVPLKFAPLLRKLAPKKITPSDFLLWERIYVNETHGVERRILLKHLIF